MAEAVLSLSRHIEQLDKDLRLDREAIVELAGRDGNAGTVGDIRKDLSDLVARVDALTLKVMGGAVGGGGIIAALIEIWRWKGG